MMVLFAALLFALAVTHPMGGRVGYLSETPYRMEFLIPLGLLTQVLPPRVLQDYVLASPGALTVISWFAGAAVLVLVCVANWSHVGFRLVAAGLLANGLVIALNQGMPVSTAALRYMGFTSTEDKTGALTPLYHLGGSDSRLIVLADVLPVPGPALVRSVVSLGDLVLMIGVAVIVLEGTRAIVRADSM